MSPASPDGERASLRSHQPYRGFTLLERVGFGAELSSVASEPLPTSLPVSSPCLVSVVLAIITGEQPACARQGLKVCRTWLAVHGRLSLGPGTKATNVGFSFQPRASRSIS